MAKGCQPTEPLCYAMLCYAMLKWSEAKSFMLGGQNGGQIVIREANTEAKFL